MSLALIASAYGISISDIDSDSECCSPPIDPDSSTVITAADTDDNHGHSQPSSLETRSGRKIIGGKTVTCSVCSKTFAGSYKLATHMRVHTRENPYQCPICKKRFQQISNVRLHLRNIHKKDSSTFSITTLWRAAKPSKEESHKPTPAPTSNATRKSSQRQASPVKNARKPNNFEFRCPYCDAIFAESNALITHLTHHDPSHPEEATSAKHPTRKTIRKIDTLNARRATGEKTACPICKCSLSRQASSVRKHMEQHSNAGWPLQCSECNLFFKTQSNLHLHKNQRHGRKPGRTMVTCKICERDFRIGTKFNNHMRIHTGERPFECLFCAKTYQQQSHLARHIRGEHAQKSTYNAAVSAKTSSHGDNQEICAKIKRQKLTCSICKCSLLGKNRSKHIKLHSGEAGRTLKCPDCPCYFKRKTDLNMHRSRHHGRLAGRTKFTCKICEKTFLGAFKLIRHMSVHNDKTTFDCPACCEIFQRSSHLVQHFKEKHGQDWSTLSKIATYFALDDRESPAKLRPCRVILVRCDAMQES